VYDAVRAHFSEVETVNLTLAITAINAWNRLVIGLGRRSVLPDGPAAHGAVPS
jgi:alkylhydroperoxidase family enzyme